MKDNRKRKAKHRKSKHCTGGMEVKYTKAERLDIGRRVYNGEMTTLVVNYPPPACAEVGASQEA